MHQLPLGMVLLAGTLYLLVAILPHAQVERQEVVYDNLKMADKAAVDSPEIAARREWVHASLDFRRGNYRAALQRAQASLGRPDMSARRVVGKEGPQVGAPLGHAERGGGPELDQDLGHETISAGCT